MALLVWKEGSEFSVVSCLLMRVFESVMTNMSLDLSQITWWLAGIWCRQGGGSLVKGWNSFCNSWLVRSGSLCPNWIPCLDNVWDHWLGRSWSSGGTRSFRALVSPELITPSAVVWGATQCGVCAQSWSRVWLLTDPIDCSPPGSSVHGISQARILEWVAISFCRGSSRPRDWTQVSWVPALLVGSSPAEPLGSPTQCSSKPKFCLSYAAFGKGLTTLCESGWARSYCYNIVWWSHGLEE